MDEDYDYRRKAKIALIAIMVFASIAVFALFVAFAYYCYILNKVSNRRKSLKKGLALFPKCAELQCSLCVLLQTPEIIRWNCCWPFCTNMQLCFSVYEKKINNIHLGVM